MTEQKIIKEVTVIAVQKGLLQGTPVGNLITVKDYPFETTFFLNSPDCKRVGKLAIGDKLTLTLERFET